MLDLRKIKKQFLPMAKIAFLFSANPTLQPPSNSHPGRTFSVFKVQNLKEE